MIIPTLSFVSNRVFTTIIVIIITGISDVIDRLPIIAFSSNIL